VNPTLSRTLRSLQRNILAGLITAGPLLVTFFICGVILDFLARAGLPLVHLLDALFPEPWLTEPWVQYVLAILLTLVVLYVVGRMTTQMMGRQAIRLFEAALQRLPFVAKVYTSVRKLIDTMLLKQEESTQRVVLIDFPCAGQKSIGFLTRTLVDSASGEILAAVLVPQAINPTSAYLQILPMDKVIESDLTMEQAMSMIMTGGAVGPETFRYGRPAEPAPEGPMVVLEESDAVLSAPFEDRSA
jgi:uncharacterized membrane protein